MDRRKKEGFALALIGALCWALSGVCGQFLFQYRGVTANWLVPVRLMTAGVLLLVTAALRQGRALLQIFRHKKDLLQLVIFAIFGLLLVQYSYFRAIQLSNAATATVIQYIGPALVVLYTAIRQHRLPQRLEVVAVLLALFGAFLLATGGDPSSLAISGEALFWALLSAVCIVVYSVQPQRIIKKYGAAAMSGWGMLIGGVLLSCVLPPVPVVGQWDGMAVLMMASIVVLGTAVAFTCYFSGVQRVGPTTGSVLSTAEPIFSALMAVCWLHVSLGAADWCGVALIVGAILLLARVQKNAEEPKKVAENV